MKWPVWIMIAGLVAALCTACSGGAGMSVENDEELAAQLRELSAEGGSAGLAELTDHEWDTVHVFGEGTRASVIKDVVGTPVISGERYYDAGNLLVFVMDGRTVAAVSVVPDLLSTGGQPTWGAGTRLEPATPSRPAVLRLVEP